MSKTVWRGGALLAPVPPALVTCRADGVDNLLTVAWTGIVNTRPPMTYISVRPERFTYPLIRKSGVFAINLTTEALVRAADLCGVRTGAKEDKFALAHLHREEASRVDVPLVAESPLCLECEVRQVLELGSHHMFLAEIVAVDVEEGLIGPNGKLDLSRAGLAAYAHGEYYALGKKLGTFGWTVRKKKKRRPPQNPPVRK